MSVVGPQFDVVIVGAGFAGAACAAVLGRDGYRVAIVDPRATCSPTFKAEKIEPDQAEILRRLGLADGVLPHGARIHAINEAHKGHILAVTPIEQYGMLYPEMVNALRRQIGANVGIQTARVVDISTSAEIQSVALDNGQTLTARIVILAAGTGGQLHEKLGFERRIVRDTQSWCSGFDVERTDGRPFAFEALTYFRDSPQTKVGYVSFFTIPGRMRVNLLSYGDAKDSWVRSLARSAPEAINAVLPGLAGVAGPWSAISKVESRPIQLYVTTTPPSDGIVLVGDAFQSVCPATGSGLSKVLTDVEVLCRTHLPEWLRSPGMPAAKIASYYRDARKTGCDRASLRAADYQRQFGTNNSLRWRLHSQKNFAMRALRGLLPGRLSLHPPQL